MKTEHFILQSTRLPELMVLERQPTVDQRGSFCRFFCAQELRDFGFSKSVAQINQTVTLEKGAVRGLHFQYPPCAETKIVSCLQGEIYDVAVDIREGSQTFLRWHGEILSRENRKSLLIPEGFAHGFQSISEGCELLYLHSAPYCADAEGAIHVNDPRIGVVWPIPITKMSERDRCHPFIPADFGGIDL